MTMTTKEEPENINTLLNALDKEIEKNPHRSNAYHQAKLLSNKYVSDCKFRLKFLRADSYDPRKAANCFVRHFETKLEDTYEGGYCNKRLLLLIALTVSWSTTTDNYQQLKLFLLSKASIAPIVDDSAD